MCQQCAVQMSDQVVRQVALYVDKRISTRNPIKWGFLMTIKGYKRFISPALPPSCRFVPTCSEYTFEAIEIHGVMRGSWMGIKRIARCNPFNPGGYDPVPPKIQPNTPNTKMQR